MIHKNVLTIVLTIIIVLGLGCVSSKSGTEKEIDLVKNPVVITTISPIEIVTPIITPIQTISATTVKNFGSVANKTMITGENWNVGGGCALTINSIDPKSAPRNVWFTLYKDGNKVDDPILDMGDIYSYNISNRYFSIKVNSIFAGNKTDLVLFKDITYQID